jgi:hypothetical protein
MIAALILSILCAQNDPDSVAKAKSLYESGGRAYEAGRYLDAIAVFEEAYRLTPRATVAYSLAQAHRLQYLSDGDLTKLKRAIELYRSYLEETPTGGRRSQALQHLSFLEPISKKLEEEAAKNPPATPAEPEPPKTRIVVSSGTPGALAKLDVSEPAEVPAVFDVVPGKHVVRVEADRYFPETVETSAVEGQVTPVVIELTPQPALIDVKAPAGAEIVVDDRQAGLAPLARPIEVTPGRHVVSVMDRGREPFVRQVELLGGDRVPVEAELETTLQRQISHYIFAGSGLLLAAGVITALTALVPEKHALEIEDILTAPQPRALTPLEVTKHQTFADERSDRVLGGTILIASSLVAGGVAALLYFLDTPRPSVTLFPIATVSGPGASIVF